MNTTEKYIYQVYLQKSFSAAAKTLFVSQPSLSAAVATKEKELGFSVFNRSTKPISLTPEGHVYIDMLEEVLESEKNMRSRIKKLTNDKYNQITIAGSSFSFYSILPLICKKFKECYPNVSVKLDIGNFGASASFTERYSLVQKLQKGDVDAVICYEHHEQNVFEHKIYDERLVVAAHKDLIPNALLPYAVSRSELLTKTFPTEKEITIKNFFKDIPFIDFSPKSNIARYFPTLLGEYAVSPYTVTNSIHSVVHFNLMKAGIGALLTSDLIVASSTADTDDILYFVFDEDRSRRSIYLITQKNISNSAHLQNFTQIAKTLFLHE